MDPRPKGASKSKKRDEESKKRDEEKKNRPQKLGDKLLVDDSTTGPAKKMPMMKNTPLERKTSLELNTPPELVRNNRPLERKIALKIVTTEDRHPPQKSLGSKEPTKLNWVDKLRIADPITAQDVEKVIQKGGQNLGVYLLKDIQGKSVAVKFSREDTRRAVFADRLLEAAGIANPNGRIATLSERQAIIDNIKKIGERYAESDNKAEQQIAPDINGMIAKASNAVSVLIMKKGDDPDCSDILEDSNADRSFINSQVFYQQLGKLFVADTVLGNSDRFSVCQGSTKLGAFSCVNPNNFKVNPKTHFISTHDNDTELPGLDLLQSRPNKKIKTIKTIKEPKDWSHFLISGGEDHISYDPENPEKKTTERITPDLEALFDQDKRKKLLEGKFYSDGLKGQVFEHSKKSLTLAVDFNEFDAALQEGIQEALEGILAHQSELLEEARRIGGADAGGGYIDPKALEYKCLYLQYRLKNLSPQKAEERMVFQMHAEMLVKFDTEFSKIPAVLMEDVWLTKTIRAVSPKDTLQKSAESLKDDARKGHLTAAALQKREKELLDQLPEIVEKDDIDRRLNKALFESKLARFHLYLDETADNLTNLKGEIDLDPDMVTLPNLGDSLKLLQSEVNSTAKVWNTKLQRLEDKKGIKKLQDSLDNLNKAIESLAKV